MADKIYKSAQIITIAFGILAPCILLAGYAYYLGYITSFGLDYSLMNRGLGDVITESWLMGVRLLLYVWSLWWMLLVIFACAMVGAFGALIYVVREKAKGIEPEKISKQNQGRTILGFNQWHWICLWELITIVASWGGVVIALAVLAGLIVLVPYQHGKQEGKIQIGKYQEAGCGPVKNDAASPARCVDLVDISSPYVPVAQGLLITANTERVAIFNQNGLEVWPLLDSYVIRKNYVSEVEPSETSE